MNYSLSEERSASAVFAEGDGAYSYEYFGARLAEKNGEKGAVFRVWAPNAQNVAVVGSFNDWNKTENFMNRNRDGVWELFIAGLRRSVPTTRRRFMTSGATNGATESGSSAGKRRIRLACP